MKEKYYIDFVNEYLNDIRERKNIADVLYIVGNPLAESYGIKNLSFCHDFSLEDSNLYNLSGCGTQIIFVEYGLNFEIPIYAIYQFHYSDNLITNNVDKFFDSFEIANKKDFAIKLKLFLERTKTKEPFNSKEYHEITSYLGLKTIREKDTLKKLLKEKDLNTFLFQSLNLSQIENPKNIENFFDNY